MAAAQDRDAAFRWLALSDEPEAAGLRAALERGFGLAGASLDVLAKGLAHERWGQHAGARGHLLALALLEDPGLTIDCEPDLGGKAPDLLVARRDEPATRVLVEVRAMTGRGEEPWHTPPRPPASTPSVPLRSERLPRSAAAAERTLRRRARAAAGERAAQAAAHHDGLAASVAHAIVAKVQSYAALVEQAHLPFVVALYEDRDHQLADIVARWGLGAAQRGAGLWIQAAEEFEALSAVLVFGRDVGPDGEVLLRGDLLRNPAARHPLPPGLLPDWAPPTYPLAAPNLRRIPMGRIVIATYRPKAGQAAALADLVKEHVPALRKRGLVTDRKAIAMRAADGTIVEVFEWKSAAAIEAAHTDPVVAEIWGRFFAISDCIPIAEHPAAAQMFPDFEPFDG